MSLYDALVNGEIEGAIDTLCLLIVDGKSDNAMATIWELLSTIGASSHALSDKLFAYWENTVSEQNALMCVIKLSILSHNIEIGQQSERKCLPNMRKDVIGMFPKTAKLSAAGSEKYSALLKNAQDRETLAFVERVLAGLSAIWTEERHEESSLAITYLTRKKLHFGEDISSDEFLWTALIAFYNGLDDDCERRLRDRKRVYDLYDDKCKKLLGKGRRGGGGGTGITGRVGLLVAGGRVYDESTLVNWDQSVLTQFSNYGKAKLKEIKERVSKYDPFHAVSDYVPRKGRSDEATDVSASRSPDVKNAKVIYT
jgi:hypothetical protein